MPTFRKNATDEEIYKFDPHAHAVTVIDEEHRLIHDGMVFSIQVVELDIPDGDVRQVLYRPQDIPVHLKRFSIAASKGPVVLTVYEAPTWDDPGSPQANTSNNLNRMSSNVATMLITGAPLLGGQPLDGADKGSPVLGGLYIPAEGNQGISGQTGAIDEIILATNAVVPEGYLIEFENDPQGSGTVDVWATVVWYELSYVPQP